MKDTILTNEWTSARQKPPIGRIVACAVQVKTGRRMKDTTTEYIFAAWTGYYWEDQRGIRIEETIGSNIVAWYMFEKFNPLNL